VNILDSNDEFRQVEPGVFDLLFQGNFGHLPQDPYQLTLSFKEVLVNQTIAAKKLFIIK
jgi:hypothetical protein